MTFIIQVACNSAAEHCLIVMSAEARHLYHEQGKLESVSMHAGIAIGGDVFPGSTLSDHCLRYENIPQIKLIVVLGELGGQDEYSLVCYSSYTSCRLIASLLATPQMHSACPQTTACSRCSIRYMMPMSSCTASVQLPVSLTHASGVLKGWCSHTVFTGIEIPICCGR